MISINIINTRVNWIKVFLLLLVGVHFSCKKQEVIQGDPYAGGKQPLGVQIVDEDPEPAKGGAGDLVTFKIKGLQNYQNDFEFLINETKAEIVSVSDSTLTVKIPDNASSGGTTVIVKGQSFFGPKFTVDGKVSVDESFKTISGTNGPIYDMIQASNGNYILVGGFTNYDNQPSDIKINAIAAITPDGAFTNTLSTGFGANGSLQTISRLSTGQYLVSGGFTTYNRRTGINGLTRLNFDGSLDSTGIEVINATPEKPLNGYDTVATFNGGVLGSVAKSFVKNDKITLLGNFQNYGHYFYERSTRDFKVLDVTRMNQIVRLKADGSMDSTFNFDPVTKRGGDGGNGYINDAFMQADGKIIAVGDFSTFHGVPSGYIVRINTDGTVDQTFATGSGADGSISSVSYNAVTNKIMLAGTFRNFNGVASTGVIMLNADGSVDNAFKFAELIGGVPNFAAQLNNGKILISGGFNKYNNIVRQGFMILNPDGSLAAGYNNTGAFVGKINKIVETTSSLGNPAAIIIGNFNKFDNKKVGNIVRVEIKP